MRTLFIISLTLLSSLATSARVYKFYTNRSGALPICVTVNGYDYWLVSTSDRLVLDIGSGGSYSVTDAYGQNMNADHFPNDDGSVSIVLGNSGWSNHGKRRIYGYENGHIVTSDGRSVSSGSSSGSSYSHSEPSFGSSIGSAIGSGLGTALATGLAVAMTSGNEWGEEKSRFDLGVCYNYGFRKEVQDVTADLTWRCGGSGIVGLTGSVAYNLRYDKRDKWDEAIKKFHWNAGVNLYLKNSYLGIGTGDYYFKKLDESCMGLYMELGYVQHIYKSLGAKISVGGALSFKCYDGENPDIAGFIKAGLVWRFLTF